MPTNYAEFYKNQQPSVPLVISEDYTQQVPWMPPQELPATPRLDAYESQIAQQPTRAQYKPRFLDRLGASLAGFSEGGMHGGGAGVQTAQGILETPFRRALSDYQTKLQGYKTAAEIENQRFNRGQLYQTNRLRQIVQQLNAQNEAAKVRQGDVRLGIEAGRAADYGRGVRSTMQRNQAYSKYMDSLPGIKAADRTQRDQAALRRDKLYGDRTQSMAASSRYRTDHRAGATPKEKFVTPKDQVQIDALALKEIRLNNPDLYAKFVKEEGEGRNKAARVMTQEPQGKGILGFGAESDEAYQNRQMEFQKFLSLLDSTRAQILQRSGLSTAGYPAIEGDEEEVDDENDGNEDLEFLN